MIRVVNLRRAAMTLYIGRKFAEFEASKWQNPFPKTRYGLDECLRRFEVYARRELWNDLHELDGHTLGCWCTGPKCHGYVLKKLREEQLELSGQTVPDEVWRGKSRRL